jgi:predicted Holliday junction resolvase-like endonuclease
MFEWIIFLMVGLSVGAILVYVLLRSSIAMSYEAEFNQWKIEYEKRIRDSALEASRAVLKGRIGEQMVALLPAFKYQPADARFIGNPVDYIIFDGYTDIKDKKSEESITVVFMDVKTGISGLTPVQEMIKDSVEKGRVKWETLRINPG